MHPLSERFSNSSSFGSMPNKPLREEPLPSPLSDLLRGSPTLSPGVLSPDIREKRSGTCTSAALRTVPCQGPTGYFGSATASPLTGPLLLHQASGRNLPHSLLAQFDKESLYWHFIILTESVICVTKGATASTVDISIPTWGELGAPRFKHLHLGFTESLTPSVPSDLKASCTLGFLEIGIQSDFPRLRSSDYSCL